MCIIGRDSPIDENGMERGQRKGRGESMNKVEI